MAGLTAGILRASASIADHSDPCLDARRRQLRLERLLTGRGVRVALIRPISACERWEIRFRVEKGDIVASPRRLTHEKSLPDFEARVLAQVALLVLVHSVIVARCHMTCQTCGLEKPPDEVNDDDGRCDSCRGEITDVRRHAPPPASVYLN